MKKENKDFASGEEMQWKSVNLAELCKKHSRERSTIF